MHGLPREVADIGQQCGPGGAEAEDGVFNDGAALADRVEEVFVVGLLLTGQVAEVARQLGSLNRQAKKAERYRRLKAEMREIDLVLLRHQFRSLGAQRDAVVREMEVGSGMGPATVAPVRFAVSTISPVD